MINNISFKNLVCRDTETLNILTYRLQCLDDVHNLGKFISDIKTISGDDEIIITGRHEKKWPNRWVKIQLSDKSDKVLTTAYMQGDCKKEEVLMAYDGLKDGLKRALAKKQSLDIKA